MSEASGDQALRNILGSHQLLFGEIQKWAKLVLKGLITGTTPTLQSQISTTAQRLKIPAALVPNLMSRLQRIAHVVTHHQYKGIGYAVDKIMGTDKHVFSIVGPHTGAYYGDIILVLRSEIMHHPGIYTQRELVYDRELTVFLTNKKKTQKTFI